MSDVAARRIDELREQIRYHDRKYYVEAAPEIPRPEIPRPRVRSTVRSDVPTSAPGDRVEVKDHRSSSCT